MPRRSRGTGGCTCGVTVGTWVARGWHAGAAHRQRPPGARGSRPAGRPAGRQGACGPHEARTRQGDDVHLAVPKDKHPRRGAAVHRAQVRVDKLVLARPIRGRHLGVEHDEVHRALVEAVPPGKVQQMRNSCPIPLTPINFRRIYAKPSRTEQHNGGKTHTYPSFSLPTGPSARLDAHRVLAAVLLVLGAPRPGRPKRPKLLSRSCNAACSR